MTTPGRNIPLLSEMDTGEILSRAWRFYRLNFRDLILYNLIPAPIFALGQILANVSQVFMQKEDPASIAACCFLYPGGLFLMIAAIFISIFFNYCLVKAIYNITIGKKANFKEIIKYAHNRIKKVILLALLLTGELIAFLLFDSFFIFFLIIFAFIPFIIFSSVLHENNVAMCIASIILFSVVFVAMIAYIIMFIIQLLIAGLQICMVSIDNTPLLNSFVIALKLSLNNLPKISWFGLCLYFLWYTLLLFFTLYGMIATGLLAALISKELVSNPIFILIVTSIWNALASMFLWPFVICAVTLFFFDHKTRVEGYDLRLSILLEKDNTGTNLSLSEN